MGQLEEAIASCYQAILLKPDFPEAYNNLGNALKDKSQLDEAIAAYRQAISFSPNHPDAHSNLGNALSDLGRLDEAIAAYRQAMALKPRFSDAHSNLLFTLNYHPGLEPATVFEEHLCWNRQQAKPARHFMQPHRNDRTPDRRLRIGYVSPDFREHPVGHFLLPLLAQHNHERFEIFCYAQVPASDGKTRQLRSQADHWHNLSGLADAQAADLIRRHQIDILVDLAGHTSNNRLPLFAHKPAPVQVTWLGYPNTTGLATMDYRLTDACADPPGLTESLHSEQLWRLPQCAWCYQSAVGPPVVARREGPITFGCFNNFAKITEPMLQLWARILHLVPGSRLLLKTGALLGENARQRVRQILGEAGIDAERLELRGYEAAHGDHLALYQRLDVALDTFPYHGTKTTCEALWMGVPVVTLAGQTHASRVGVSLLNNIGLPELVASTPEEYVRLAVELAGDLPRLSQLRSTLRPQMEGSPLMDAPRFAQDVEEAYLAMWRHWCAK
jgi:predicted O-linked N-acetylglucosamine transferase (SPINDLY family)